MAVKISYYAGAGQQFFDNEGNILSGGKIYAYLAGTTTPATTYTSRTGITPNTNPIILDGYGRLANEVWLTEGSDYKFVIKDSSDVTIQTLDYIPPVNDNREIAAVYADFASTSNNAKGDALVGFRQAGTLGFLSGSVGRTLSNKMQEFISVLDFGADPTGLLDSLSAFRNAIQNAINGQTIIIPAGVYTVSGSITVPRGVNVVGSGMGFGTFSGTAIKTTTNSLDEIFITGASSGAIQGSTISNMSLWNNGNALHAIRNKGSNLTIKNVYIAPYPTTGTPFGTGVGNDTGDAFDHDNIHCENVYIYGCTRGFRFTRSFGINLVNCTSLSNGTGVVLNNCAGVNIEAGNYYLLGTNGGAETNTSKLFDFTGVKGYNINANRIKVASDTLNGIGQQMLTTGTSSVSSGGCIKGNYIETNQANSNAYDLIYLGASVGCEIVSNKVSNCGSASTFVSANTVTYLASNIIGNNSLDNSAKEYNNALTVTLSTGLTSGTDTSVIFMRNPASITVIGYIQITATTGSAQIAISGFPLLGTYALSGNLAPIGFIMMTGMDSSVQSTATMQVRQTASGEIGVYNRLTASTSGGFMIASNLSNSTIMQFTFTYPIKV